MTEAMRIDNVALVQGLDRGSHAAHIHCAAAEPAVDQL